MSVGSVQSTSSTGYGLPSNSRYQNLQFNGDEREYEIWEARFLGYMLLKNLDETADPASTTDPDAAKNKQVYAELIQFLDKRSLSLIMRDAKDKGREAINLLREHLRGKGKQRIISLYTELTSLSKREKI